MRASFGLLAIFVSTIFAAPAPSGPSDTCDVNSDNCRAVINASACFNEFMSGGSGNKNSVLNCLAGTDGAATPTQKVELPDIQCDNAQANNPLQMCACTGCVAPVLTQWIAKNKVCT